MGLSTLIEEFAAVGVTLAQTPDGKLFVTPKRLVTDDMRAKLKVEKARLEAPEPLEVVTSDAQQEGDTLATEHEAPAVHDPILAALSRQELNPDSYGIRNGTWEGPEIEELPRGVCASCCWEGVPLAILCEESRCVLCWQADRDRDGQPLTCNVFCDNKTILLRPSRYEPGSWLSCPSCPSCTARMLAIQEESARCKAVTQ